jgi:hypothetical protein
MLNEHCDLLLQKLRLLATESEGLKYSEPQNADFPYYVKELLMNADQEYVTLGKIFYEELKKDSDIAPIETKIEKIRLTIKVLSDANSQYLQKAVPPSIWIENAKMDAGIRNKAKYAATYKSILSRRGAIAPKTRRKFLPRWLRKLLGQQLSPTPSK